MNGALRGELRQAPIGQPQNALLLSMANPPFNIQNTSHLSQPSMSSTPMSMSQSVNPSNQSMGMLANGQVQQGPGTQQRFGPPTHMSPQAVQQRMQLMRQQGPNQPQLNSAPTGPQVPMQGMPFGGGLITQSQMQNAAVRRVQSQPHILGGPVPNQVPGTMQMSMNPQTSMPAHLRQAAAVNQNQQRMMQQQQQAMMQQGGLSNNDIAGLTMSRQTANPAMQQNVSRTASGQPPMSSLPQPPMGGSSLPGGMQSHQQTPFPGSNPMPSQHQPPPISSSPRPPPGYNPSQFPGNNGRPGPSGPPGYNFAPSPTPSMPVGGEGPQPSSSGMMQGGAPNRANFPTQGPQQFDIMGNNEVYPNFAMHPPTTVPPRPPSMAGPHQPPGAQSQSSQNMLQGQSQQPTPQQQQQQQGGSQQSSNPQQMQSSQQQQQQQQQQASQSHQSSPRINQMGAHPQRPQSQPRHATPGRPPSQAGGQRNTPASGMGPGPGTNNGAGPSTGPVGGNASGGPSQQQARAMQVGIGAPLTGVGRIQQQGGQQAGTLPAIAPRPGPSGMPAQNAQGGPSVIGGALPNGGDVTQPQPLFRPIGGGLNSGNGQGVLRLLQFSGILASENKMKLQLAYWNDLVKEYFTPKAIMKLTLWKDNQRNEAKPFVEIGVPILPRFFLVTTQSGVKSMTLSLDGARERQFGHGHYVVECVGAVWTYKYTNGYVVTLRGPLTAHVLVHTVAVPGQNPVQGFRFEEIQFDANYHDKYIALDSIAGKRSIDERRPSPEAEGNSPATITGQQHKWEEPRIMLDGASIPGEPVNAFGIPQATMRCLELAESVSSMTDLITFANDNGLGPQAALKKLAHKLREGNQPPMGSMLPPNGHQPPQPPPPQPMPGPIPPQPPMMNGMIHTGPSNGHLASPFQPFPASSSSNPSVTLYSAAPASVTNPQPPLNTSVNSPKNASASASNSPDKQNKSIPQSIPGSMSQQQQQQQQQHMQQQHQQQMQMQMQAHTPQQIPGPGSSPAISSGGTTNTPSMTHANPNLKRKQAGGGGGDAASPTIGGGPSQEKRVRGAKRQKGPGS